MLPKHPHITKPHTHAHTHTPTHYVSEHVNFQYSFIKNSENRAWLDWILLAVLTALWESLHGTADTPVPRAGLEPTVQGRTAAGTPAMYPCGNTHSCLQYEVNVAPI